MQLSSKLKDRHARTKRAWLAPLGALAPGILAFAAASYLSGCGSAASPRWAGTAPPETAPAETVRIERPVASNPQTPPPNVSPPPVAARPPAATPPQTGKPAAVGPSEIVVAVPGLTPLARSGPYRIGVGDELQLSLPYEPGYGAINVIVRPDGMVTAPLLQDVRAAGLTPTQLDTLLLAEYAKILRHPVLTVAVNRIANNQVYVMGEVIVPGPVDINGSISLLQLIGKAGGIKATGTWKSVVVLHRMEGNKVAARRVNLKRIMEGRPDAPDLQLSPTDVAYVPRTFIAKLDDFVDQYVTHFAGELTSAYLRGWEIVEPSRFFLGTTRTTDTTTGR